MERRRGFARITRGITRRANLIVRAVKANRFAARVLEINGRFGEDGGSNLTAALAYYAFFSLFPLMLLGASAVGFLLARDPAAQARLAQKLAGTVPGLGSLIGRNIGAVVEHRNATGLLGLVGALWSGTALARTAAFALARVHRTKEPGNYFATQAWAIGSTLGLGLLALVTTVLATSVRTVDVTGPTRIGLFAAAVGASLVLDLGLFVAAYKVLHRGPSTPIRRIWRGALLPAIGWTGLKFGGSWYAARTVKGSTPVFGALSSVVGILVVLFLISRLFVLGAEVNAVFEPKSQPATRERKAA